MKASAFRTKTMGDKIFLYKVPSLETKWMKEEKKEDVEGLFSIFLCTYFHKSDYKWKRKKKSRKKCSKPHLSLCESRNFETKAKAALWWNHKNISWGGSSTQKLNLPRNYRYYTEEKYMLKIHQYSKTFSETSFKNICIPWCISCSQEFAPEN